MNNVKSNDDVNYEVDSVNVEDATIKHALSILESRMTVKGNALTSPNDTVSYLKLRLAQHEREIFAVLFLDTRHRVIEYQEMFSGTINGASVHPREVVKKALKLNAAAVIFSHNHPSGEAEPSEADRQLTNRLRDVLALVDVRALDHVVVTGSSHVSFAERGWI